MAIDPRMITLVREARGWTQKELAERAGITQGHLSKVEAGLAEIGPSTRDAVVEALECPEALLEVSLPVRGVEVTCLHHRRRASTMTASTKRRIEAVTHLTSLSVKGLLADVRLGGVRQLPRSGSGETLDPKDAARATRVALGVTTGPIPHVIKAVESAGVIVVQRALGTASQDAVSTWPRDHGFPLMVLNTGLATDRLRFTVAHELGHLVMHSMPGDEQETEANIFAGEFLAPAEEIRPDLDGLKQTDLQRLLTMKSKWGMSIAALIRRAFDIGIVDDASYRDFQIRLGRLGWRTAEPGTLTPETPSSLARIIDLRRTAQQLSVDELATEALMSPSAFRRHYLPEEQTESAKLTLEVGDV